MDQKLEGFDSLEEVAAAIADYQTHRRPPCTLDGLAKNLRIASNGKYRWHWIRAILLCGTTSRAVRPALRTMRASSSSRRSWYVACYPTWSAKRACGDSSAFVRKYVSVANAGHMVAGDRNDVFGSAVYEFLSRTVPVS